MRQLFLALATSLLLAACSSGGGTSSSSGGIAGFTSGSTGLVIFAVIDVENFSSDTLASDCDDPPDGIAEQRITSDLGTITVTVQDNSLVTTSTNKGIIFNSYTVSFTGVTPGAPALASRTHSETLPIFLGTATTASGEVSIVIVELDTTKPEFNKKNLKGGVFTYRVQVTYRGSRMDTGEAVSVAAGTTIEMGDFCEGDA